MKDMSRSCKRKAYADDKSAAMNDENFIKLFEVIPFVATTHERPDK